MTIVTKLNRNDRHLWDQYVSACAKTTPYHRFAWGQAIEKSYGFEAIYVGAFYYDNLVGIMPLIRMGVPLRQKSLISLPYCDGAGAIADNQEALDALIAFANNDIAKDTQEPVELRNADTTMVDPDTLADGQKVRMLLSLAATPDEQMANFKSKLRSQIRKAEKNGLTSKVIEYNDTDDFAKHVDEFYAVFAGNMHSLGSPVHSKAWFMAVLSGYANNAYMVLVYKDETVVGGGIVLLNNNTASIPWASTNAQYNRLAPNMLLYWTVLSEAITKGAQVFDFGRSTLNEGTYNFKKQWGSQPAPLNWVRYENGNLVEVVDLGKSTARELLETMWQKLPLWLVNYVGPKVRKFVSL
jgi:FemAB-related protein (PEP-CTERM system-associated)